MRGFEKLLRIRKAVNHIKRVSGLAKKDERSAIPNKKAPRTWRATRGKVARLKGDIQGARNNLALPHERARAN
jgi:hypothetical protein